jgi:hypothetical protein
LWSSGGAGVADHRLTVACRDVLDGTGRVVERRQRRVPDRVDRTASTLAFDVTDETLERSSLGRMRRMTGSTSTRRLLGARWVDTSSRGMFDVVGTVAALTRTGAARHAPDRAPTSLRRLRREKGSWPSTA